MAKGYWVVDLEVTDLEAYKAYQAFVRPFVSSTGGRFLVRGGALDVVEGSSMPRVVVIEYPSFDAALSAYNSSEYQQGRLLRVDCSHGNLRIVEGFDEV